MQKSKLILIVFVIHVLLLSGASFAQSADVNTSNIDPAALGLVGNVVHACGADQSQRLSMQGAGSIDFNWAGTSVVAPAQVWGTDSGDFRLDASLPKGTRTLKISGGAGVIADERGNHVLNDGTIALTSNPLLPCSELAQAVKANAAIELLPKGDNSLYTVISVSRTFPDLPEYGGFRKSYFVDAALHIVGTDETVFPNVSEKVKRAYTYSSFTVSNGVTIPMSVSEFVNGQRTWTLSLSTTASGAPIPPDTFKF